MSALFVQFSDCGKHIRRWSREPFDGAVEYTAETVEQAKPQHPDRARFRKSGMTEDALNYPLTEGGVAIVAEHNGVAVEQMPAEWHFAPNAWMQRWLNNLGERKARGEQVRAAGRWLP